MHIKKERIKESLNDGICEIEHAKDRVKTLENEKKSVLYDFQHLNEDNKKIKTENQNKQILIDKYEIDLKDYPLKVNEISILKREKESIQNELDTIRNKSNVIKNLIL